MNHSDVLTVQIPHQRVSSRGRCTQSMSTLFRFTTSICQNLTQTPSSLCVKFQITTTLVRAIIHNHMDIQKICSIVHSCRSRQIIFRNKKWKDIQFTFISFLSTGGCWTTRLARTRTLTILLIIDLLLRTVTKTMNQINKWMTESCHISSWMEKWHKGKLTAEVCKAKCVRRNEYILTCLCSSCTTLNSKYLMGLKEIFKLKSDFGFDIIQKSLDTGQCRKSVTHKGKEYHP